MKGTRFLQSLGLFIAVPLMVFAVHENYWAEPLQPTIEQVIEPAFEVEIIHDQEEGDTEEAEEAEPETKPEFEMDSIELMARCVEAEAGNQSILGKRLVVDTILNRVNSPIFPATVKEVIYQPGQFSVAHNGQIDRVTPTAETYNAIALEFISRVSEEVIYFQPGGYPAYGEAWERVGDHYFSTMKGGNK